jgi:short-subunit dehydrogenase
MNKNSHIRSLFEKTISGSFVSKIAWPGRVSVISVFGLARIFCEVGLSQNTKNEIFFASDGDPISFAKLFSRMGDLCGVKAGHIRLPKVFVKFLLLFKRFLPFTLKSLLIDVMSVNNGKLVSCSIVPKKRGDDFLLDVYRYINLQKYPGRIFSKAAVTGAAGGIGKSLAEKFYGEGYSLFLIDKNEEALRAFSLGLQSGYVVFDLISPLSLSDKSQVYSEILKNISDLYIFVNNAGIGQKGYFTEIDINKSISQVWLNCCVPIYFSKEVLESFSSAGSGILINIISSAAFQPLPTMAVYAASKAFLLSFTEALAVEAKTSSGIKVIGVCPSGTETNFQDNSGVKKNPKERLLSPSFVANEVFLSMNRNRFISIVGLSGLIMSFMARFIPRKLAPILWFSLMNKKR